MVYPNIARKYVSIALVSILTYLFSVSIDFSWVLREYTRDTYAKFATNATYFILALYLFIFDTYSNVIGRNNFSFSEDD